MSSEEYLKHAEECEILAAMARLDANKRALLESAAMWRSLANATTPGDGSDGKSALSTGRPR
jgi:hypothetical protein